MKLSELKVGQRAKIIELKAKGAVKRRLMDMGVIVGESLRVQKIAPLGDPIEVVIKNYHLSLRKSEAEQIEVEVLK